MASGLAIAFALLLIANGVMAWRTERRLETKRAALRAAGQPASIAELAPPPVNDEANAAVHVERVKSQLDSFAKQQSAFFKADQDDTWTKRKADGLPPTAAQALAVRTTVDAHPELATALQRAAACDAYASRLDFTLPHRLFLQTIMDRQLNVRTLARYIDWKTIILALDGKTDEAVDWGTQLLRLGRLYEHEPTLVNYLISVAVRSHAIDGLNRSLRSGPVSNETRNRLLAELEIQDRPAIRKALQSEWAFVLDYPQDATVGIPAPLNWPIKKWMLGEAEFLDEAIAAADQPYFKLRAQWAAAARDGNGQALLKPAVQAAIQSDARRQALVRSLRILIALDDFQRLNGKEATGLEDLGLPAAAVSDPFSGEPLILKHAENGWVIYSVMENGMDDGGIFTDVKDYGLAPAGWRPSE